MNRPKWSVYIGRDRDQDRDRFLHQYGIGFSDILVSRYNGPRSMQISIGSGTHFIGLGVGQCTLSLTQDCRKILNRNRLDLAVVIIGNI